MYAGPAHIGTLRVASSFKNVHAIMHAPLGDDYFNVMRSMLERERDFTPVTASIVDRHVLARGSQEKVVENITRKDKEERPDLIILTPTCTSSILQEDLQNFVDRAALESESDVLLADVNHYRVNELQAADRTLEQVVRFYVEKARKQNNLATVNEVIPEGGSVTVNFEDYIEQQTRFVSQAAWFSRSIDCQNLTGKKAVVFGDATHAASMTKILAREMGIRVSCAGTYCKHDADWFREQVQGFCDEVLITDDHTHVGDMIARIEPAAIFGTQMERHIGKRLDIPCGVISAPVHIQNFPLGYRPFLGYEGTNQIADLVYNSFTLGMEDHLLEIFGGHDTKEVITKSLSTEGGLVWATDGLAELTKIPGFVRGKIKRNTEKFASDNNITTITLEVMYAAKEAAGA
nr:photochlorophyllide reductase subunit B [Coccomyxa sp. SUA001]